jgi:exosortase F-associated protein
MDSKIFKAKEMKLTIRIGLILLLVLLLFLARAISQNFFYDPLHQYFLGDYLHTSLPKIQLSKYYLFLFIKYFINALLSIGIIHLAFMNTKWTVFSVKFYLFAFFVLSILLVLFLKTDFYNDYLLIFYLRRFLIHPIFILVLLPAFYYQKISN